ncbi:Crossover junction endonuclease mus81 [Aspergillus fumigatus]|nr:Crossover junction endonuclease mus81 [Aspergillus fumigatus]KAH1548095.1 Crossover junction endonuclease mus81 [Aspergillus fumigatus]KAH1741534.1 Crossover junction endonuclease mus81 [Aspergillus fumigatus]KAH1916190.1 Crossover junction endonuclease mus81 [Aspergillus fumigatus]KAH1974477.1 Crossover junction endonuclease mus81 [Aspergillus fumigatus]
MSESCANPLLLEWIKEWLDQARERNSKGVTVYKKAYESMKACPLVFQHPSEAQQLNGLGPKLCERLTEKLKAYCEENGLPMPEHPQKAAASKRTSDEGVDDPPAKKPRKAKPYVPSLRSGPYALLLGLATLDENASQGLTKAQLIEKAQPYCDSSFTAPPDPSKFYTAWNSMKTLLQKELVYEHGRPLRRYALTGEGWEVAKRIKKTLPGGDLNTLAFRHQTGILSIEQGDSSTHVRSNTSTSAAPGPRDNDNNIVAQESLNGNNDEPIQIQDNDRGRDPIDEIGIEPIILPANSFTIQLVLDTREVRSSKDRDYIANELSKKGITPEVRALELGDAMWIARCNDPTFLSQYGEECNEVMLDWIVERKRMDDLLGSIKDGRFHEQKFRLRRSGIKNVIYLIEEFAITHDVGSASAMKYQEMMASAIASTQVVNGYFVKQTRNLDDTIRYLARMTYLLQKMYCFSPPTHTLSLIPSRQLSSAQSYLTTLERLRARDPSVTYSVTFSTFSALTSKSDILSLRDVFLKMLMCTRGVTGEKALEIQKRWSTPREFVEAFERLDEKGREDMVFERTKTLVGRKKMGKVLSKKIADIWGTGG